MAEMAIEPQMGLEAALARRLNGHTANLAVFRPSTLPPKQSAAGSPENSPNFARSGVFWRVRRHKTRKHTARGKA